MRANTRLVLPGFPVEKGRGRYSAAIRRFACFWGAFGAALVLSLAGLTLAADGMAIGSAESIDSRWLPWIGSWRLISDPVSETDKTAKENYLLEIRPGDHEGSIVMKSFQDEKLLLETKITADGSRLPLVDSRCSGWYRYFWSDTGKRLLFESEAGCPAEVPRFISGISVITDNRDWFDIQLLSSGEDRAVSVRKYRTASDSAGARTGPGVIGAPRFLAGTSLSIDEVIELSHKIPQELLEAAILELQRPFKINSSTLKRLSDAGVQPGVVDLMVALSFPDKFSVSRQRISPVREAGPAPKGIYYSPAYTWVPFGYWSVYGPYSSWYWGTPLYGYWGWGWDVWSRGHSRGYYGGGGDRGGGVLVNGRGYSRVQPGGSNAQPRYAQPRNSSGAGSRGYQVNTGSSSTAPANSGSGASGPASGGSSGSGSGGSAPSPRAAPSASPGGYHGGDGSGHKAKPRD